MLLPALCGVVVLLCSVASVSPYAFKGSRLGTTDYNLEHAVVKLGKRDFHRAVMSTLARKELLCVTFLHTNDTVIENFVQNVLAMGSTCDWAAIFYKGSVSEIRSTCDSVRIAKHMVHCKRSEETLHSRYVTSGLDTDGISNQSMVKLSVPKTVMYRDLLPLLPNYKKVFLMDEDISLQDFNVSTLLLHWECALSPPPLIVQPLVFESNQYINYLNENSWRRKDRSRIVASGVGLVEQQVPMFESVFFEWFVRRVLALTRDTALVNGVDWGHDRSWCHAARMYGRYVLNYPEDSTPCAVLPRATSIHHLNYRSMGNKRENRTAFEQRGNTVVQRYIDLFPTWVVLDVLGANNPLDFRNSGLHRKVFQLNATCVAGTQKGGASLIGSLWQARGESNRTDSAKEARMEGTSTGLGDSVGKVMGTPASGHAGNAATGKGSGGRTGGGKAGGTGAGRKRGGHRKHHRGGKGHSQSQAQHHGGDRGRVTRGDGAGAGGPGTDGGGIRVAGPSSERKGDGIVIVNRPPATVAEWEKQRGGQ